VTGVQTCALPISENLNANASFTSKIDDDIIASIMLLKDVDDSWKILLLLGIGVFTEHKSIAYTEIMKKLADSQKLYLIIAREFPMIVCSVIDLYFYFLSFCYLA
jgi:hypothetical protein